VRVWKLTELPPEPSSILPVFDARQHVDHDPASAESIDRVRGWLHDCRKNHAACQQAKPDPPELPTRVIDVGSAHGSEDPYLYESGGQQADYIALSHCWGKNPVIMTTQNTLNSRKAAIEWSSLPKTFQDTIGLTRQFGVKYLWIDSLCIIQDDTADWRCEASRMGTVYQNACLVISAAGASDSRQGFLNLRAQPQEIQATDADGHSASVFARTWEPLDHARFSKRLGSTSMKAEMNVVSEHQLPLFKRAWVLQERLLAKRVLHYTSFERIWECNTTQACECGGISERLGSCYADSGANFKVAHCRQMAEPDTAQRMRHWEYLVLHYSRRELTYASDKLVAISGMARQISLPAMGRYLAGIWESELVRELQWITLKPTGEEIHRKRLPNQAPSWSWAASEGPLTWFGGQYGETEEVFRSVIVEIDAGYDLPGGFEKTDSGYLRVRGLWASSTNDFTRTMFTNLDPVGYAIFDPSVHDEWGLLCLQAFLEKPRHASQAIKIDIRALILVASKTVPRAYERLEADMINAGQNSLEALEERVITLV
jgi:hypothetical protein